MSVFLFRRPKSRHSNSVKGYCRCTSALLSSLLPAHLLLDRSEVEPTWSVSTGHRSLLWLRATCSVSFCPLRQIQHVCSWFVTWTLLSVWTRVNVRVWTANLWKRKLMWPCLTDWSYTQIHLIVAAVVFLMSTSLLQPHYSCADSSVWTFWVSFSSCNIVASPGYHMGYVCLPVQSFFSIS